jgi:hypothetical protein
LPSVVDVGTEVPVVGAVVPRGFTLVVLVRGRVVVEPGFVVVVLFPPVVLVVDPTGPTVVLVVDDGGCVVVVVLDVVDVVVDRVDSVVDVELLDDEDGGGGLPPTTSFCITMLEIFGVVHTSPAATAAWRVKSRRARRLPP